MQDANSIIAPSKQGVMVGFPPPPDKRVTAANCYQPEHMAWRIQNTTRLFPSARISRGADSISILPQGERLDIERLAVAASDGTSLPMQEVLRRTSVDSMIVMHRGRVVYEGYFGDMTDSKVHAMYSCTKSVIGLLVEALIHEGTLDETRPASAYVPELQASPAGSATVRELLDMRANFMFSEKPKIPGQVQVDYIMGLGFIPRPTDYSGPNGVYELLSGAKSMGSHGGMFRYDNGSTDTLGWILRKVTGQTLDTLIGDLIWSQLGAERDAGMSIDASGVEWAAAGMSAILRDFARLGETLRCHGAFNGRQILPSAVYQKIKMGGDRECFGDGGGGNMSGGSYRSQWWFYHDRFDSFACRGQYGQRLWIAPNAETLVAQFAVDSTLSALEPLRLSGFQAIADSMA
ncbi:serine hydrolase domain-containing protein [Cupriavidus basilensis]|uniref:serine hydrolase domain-containing protein n=1 Tax=Cupriavidus basilensis TaxID=68895 RepID=UPI0023E7C3E1|nr:serine hydrolase [Cupriavidus basilensis]MDF3881842.1 serine hydrolase [Cupriavidus basilensis]